MSDTPPPEALGEGSTPAEPPTESSVWDPRQVMQDRATATRRHRDAAIADLRDEMSDDEVLAEFGIDLGEIER